MIISATLLTAVGLADPLQAQGNIPAGLTVSGNLDATDNVLANDGTYYDDWFYNGRAGERITVTQTSTDFASWLSIGRVESGVFMYDKSTGRTSGDQARIVYDVPADGRYVIRVNLAASGSRTGAYTLRVDRAGTASTSSSTIPILSALMGSLGGSGDRQSASGVYQDTYTFTGSKGDIVEIEMMTTEFDSYLDLYRGSTAVTSDDDGGEGLNARIRHVLTESGTYTIYARSRRPNQTGFYALSFRSTGQTGARPTATTPTGTSATIAAAQTPSPARREEAAGASPTGLYTIGLNQSVTGNLSFTDREMADGAHYDAWKFSGRAGQRIRITLEASGFTPLLIFGLNDETSEIVTSREDVAEDDDATIDFNITVSGEYAILVTSHPQSTPFGGYKLTVRSR